MAVEAQGDVTELVLAQTLIKAGDWDGAEPLLAELASRNDAPVLAKLLYSRVLLRRSKKDEALAVARAASTDFPANKRVQSHFANTLIKVGRVDEATQQLNQLAEKFPEYAPIQALRAEAALKGKDTVQAMRSIDRACELDPEDAKFALLKVVVLCAIGERGRAGLLIRETSLDTDLLADYFQDFISYHTKRNRRDEAFALSEGACALLPNAVMIGIQHANRLLAASRPKEARDVLEQITVAPDAMERDQATRFVKTKAQVFQAMNERESAIAEFKNVLAFEPEDRDALRALYILHQQLGRIDDMKDYGRQLAGAGAKSMPSTLAEGLDAIAPTKRNGRMDSAKLDWAWETTDKSRWDRESWLAALEWGSQADALLRAWWLNMPDRLGELDALIDRPAQGGAIGALPEGARCLAVTTHLGPMAGNVRFMQTCGKPFRGFGFVGPDPVTGDGPPMRISANISKPTAALRTLVEEIKKGTLIGFAQDSPDRDHSLRLEFLGRPISTLVPRLILKHKTASVWCQALWRGKRIIVECERLPDPIDDEPLSQWCERWCAAYLRKIEAVMRDQPENLNLGAGIWQNVNANFASRRRAGDKTIAPNMRRPTGLVESKNLNR